MKYFQFFDKRIIKRRGDQPYLIRWTILGFGIDSSWFSIKVHNILISDEECLHNHPWAFISIILKGSYLEDTRSYMEDYYEGKKDWSKPAFSTKNGFPVRNKIFRAGNILYRPANWAHRLQLKEPVWTLVFTFRKIQPWGFFTKNGWIPHWKYSEEKDC